MNHKRVHLRIARTRHDVQPNIAAYMRQRACSERCAAVSVDRRGSVRILQRVDISGRRTDQRDLIGLRIQRARCDIDADIAGRPAEHVRANGYGRRR